MTTLEEGAFYVVRDRAAGHTRIRQYKNGMWWEPGSQNPEPVRQWEIERKIAKGKPKPEEAKAQPAAEATIVTKAEETLTIVGVTIHRVEGQYVDRASSCDTCIKLNNNPVDIRCRIGCSMKTVNTWPAALTPADANHCMGYEYNPASFMPFILKAISSARWYVPRTVRLGFKFKSSIAGKTKEVVVPLDVLMLDEKKNDNLINVIRKLIGV